MSTIEIYGDAGDYSGSYEDDGSHFNQRLKPCPFCGKDTELEICNTHTPIFWVKCECGCEMSGPYVEGAGRMPTERAALEGFKIALLAAVAQWNSRRG
ncbi:hypothetical protein D7B12_18140 [Salmonella enterica]|nr:hypothetical protein [Salmonella enterica]